MAKKLDELERPKIPGYIDMSKVNSAAGNVAEARDAINNLNYDTFKQGSQYGNLKKSYEQQGQTAMKDTLGQVAARTGGMASSYATSAANQSYNNYMQTLEDAARSMFNEEYQKKMDAYNMAQQEYGNEWNRYQNEYSQAWDKYNAENSAYESDWNHNYQLGRDEKTDADAATAQAQDDILAIWQAGGTPSPELLQAAGWYDEATGGLSATGAAYKSGIDDKRSKEDKTEAQGLVKDMWASGLTPTDDQLVAAGYMTKGADGKYQWTDEGLAAMYAGTGLTDTELEQIFGAEGFDWDTYDFDKDGKVGDADTDGEDMSGFFANSSYGEDYWRQFATDKQQGYADQDTKDTQAANTNQIDAMLKNGASLEDVAKKYLIGDEYRHAVDAIGNAIASYGFENVQPSNEAEEYILQRVRSGESIQSLEEMVNGENTWESVTGMSKDEWKVKQTGYRQGSYKFPNTSAGRSDIMDILIESDNLTLSPTDADNFDYLYGDGAYDAIQKFSDNILSIQYGHDPEDDEDKYFTAYSWAKKVSPYLSDDIFDRIVQTINPELWDFMFPSK